MNDKFKKQVIFLVIIAVVLAGGSFWGGLKFEEFKLEQESSATTTIFTEILNPEKDKPAGIDFGLFWETLNTLEEKFVDQEKVGDKGKLVYGAIEGLVNSLGDPYTVFMQPKETKQFEEQIDGSFSGIGIEIGLRESLLTVIAPIKDTPAQKAGLEAGDIIAAINGEDTSGIVLDTAVSKIRGKKGTTVKLTIMRRGWKETRDFVIVRDTIRIPAIQWELKEDRDGQKTIAYVQLFVFNRNTDQEFEKIAKEIIKAKAKSMILDLRNNPGGLLDSAVYITSWFLEPDKVVVRERFADQTETSLRTQNIGQLKDYPLVVLINKGSASASEILAGALRDQRGITIVGENSFGKGSVQELIDLNSDTKNRSTLKVTVAKWYTPNGTSINDGGIKPDVEVAPPTEEELAKNPKSDPQLDKAVELLSANKI